MFLQDVDIHGIGDGLLRLLLGNELRVAHDELVRRLVVGHEEDHRRLLPASRPSGLLPDTGDGAREAHGDDCIQPPDVDA